MLGLDGLYCVILLPRIPPNQIKAKKGPVAIAYLREEHSKRTTVLSTSLAKCMFRKVVFQTVSTR